MAEKDRIQELERRLALLEARMTTSTDWMPDPEDLAQGFLWMKGRCDNGPYIGEQQRGTGPDPAPAVGHTVVDLASEALRPRTWAQLLDALQFLAQEVMVLVNDANYADPDDPSERGLFGLPPVSDEEKEQLATVLAAARAKRGN